MAIVETEKDNGIMVIRLNRPDRLNALGTEMRAALTEAWREFHSSRDVEVAIYTGTGRAFDKRCHRGRAQGAESDADSGSDGEPSRGAASERGCVQQVCRR